MTSTPTSDLTSARPQLHVSVVIPCLNEADTVAGCVATAVAAMTKAGISGEVVVADNGSTDASRQLAEAAGARVVSVPLPGYGSALMGGIEAANGRLIIMGDADQSYDFGEAPKIVAKLEEGFDLVMGCRLPWGGGRIMPGAMPFLHRWWGNPMFTLIARWWFRAPINDVCCGLRGFTKESYHRLELQCTGMEFANEMIVRASLTGQRIGEVPVTLHPDQRKSHPPHLRTFRDGWRTLRFYLLFSPRWLFLIPGLVLTLLGAAAAVMGYAGVRIQSAGLDVHTLLFGAVMMIAGYQAVIFAILTKMFSINAGLLPADKRLRRFSTSFSLERGLVLAAILTALGVGMMVATVVVWAQRDFGTLPYGRTMRIAIPGVLATVMGLQTAFFVFFAGVLQLDRRGRAI